MRLTVTELERRDTVGNLLDALMAAAFGGTPTDPLDQLPAFLDRPPLVGVGTGEHEAAAGAAFMPTSPPVFPDRSPVMAWLPEPASAASGQTAPADPGFVSLPIEDPLLFSIASTAATPGAVVPAGGMQPTDAAPSGSGTTATGPGPSVGVSAVQSASAPVGASDAPILRAPASSAGATTGGTVAVGQTAQPVGSTTIVGGSGLPTRVNNEYIADDLPPNTAPVAGDDSATMDEDGGSVVIDVLANDTDDDGDSLLISDWDWKPAHGTVTQTSDRKLEYTPFPDFNGKETFTYTATDGRDASNTATVTVTVTVNSVNDAPAAFKDGFSVYNPYVYTDANGDGQITDEDASVPEQYGSGSIGSVLTNDIDYDGPHGDLYVADKKMSSLPSGISVDLNMITGNVTVGGPAWFMGQVVFSYQTADGEGGVSDWVTATIFVLGPLGDGMPGNDMVARPDTVVVGDDPSGLNVRENDDYADLTVVASQPDHGRLSDFSGGSITVTPDLVPQDSVFTYTNFSSDGRSAGAEVKVVALKMELFNGQGGKDPVRAENRNDTGGRVAIGAFTVVNRNDTDSNGVIDRDQTVGVIAGQVVNGKAAPGENEKDLMRLSVYKPTGFGNDANDRLTVTVTRGAARYFATPWRETNLGQTLTLTAADFVVNGKQVASRDYWVEIYETTVNKRDVTIELKWGASAPYQVQATGIWATFDTPGGFHVTGIAPSTDADARRYRETFNSLGSLPGFTLGKPGMLLLPRTAGGKIVSYITYLVNTMETEFTTTPTGIGTEPGVKFDLSRTIENRSWYQLKGSGIAEDKTDAMNLPANRDSANDDSSNFDEDTEPTNNHIYQLDFPGHAYPITTGAKDAGQYNVSPDPNFVFLRYVRHMNALEFVRVKLDGTDFTQPAQGVHGSRDSELVPWHSWSDFQWNGNAWVRTANTADATYNDINLGIPWNLNTPAIV